MRTWFGLIALVSALASPAQAEGIREISKTTMSLTRSFKKGELGEWTQKALNRMVQVGVAELRIKGENDLADQFEREWGDRFANWFLSVQAFGIGDHAPLNEWLRNFYAKLEEKLGETILRLTGLSDVNTMNFAIFVAFKPRGDKDRNDFWDKAEYQLHFNEFSSITVYWAASAACSVAVHGILSHLCGIAALAPRYAMKEWVSPPIGDWIYDVANGTKRAPEAPVEMEKLAAFFN